jgi:hypothetical protein
VNPTSDRLDALARQVPPSGRYRHKHDPLEPILYGPHLAMGRTLEVLMGMLSWFFGGADREDVAQIDNPATAFKKPSDVVGDSTLSHDEKKQALNNWEQDARQLMTASNEGMPGREEGLDPDDHHHMAEVVRAKEALGEKPKHKPAH